MKARGDQVNNNDVMCISIRWHGATDREFIYRCWHDGLWWRLRYSKKPR